MKNSPTPHINNHILLSKMCFVLPTSLQKRVGDSISAFIKKQYIEFCLRKNNIGRLTQYNDFIDWYISSMNAYSEEWLNTARSCFPDTHIYMVTGGDGNPMTGADFAEQAKTASRYDSGLRVTNQTDNYEETFALSRWAFTAARAYGSYFTTEEAWFSRPESIPMRLYDAANNGASGAYFKTILDSGIVDGCQMKVRGCGSVGSVLKDNLSYIKNDVKQLDVAVFIPTTTIRLIPGSLGVIYDFAMRVRPYIDFDFISETMIVDGNLDRYKHLIIADSAIIADEVNNIMDKWQQQGGILHKRIDDSFYMANSGKMIILNRADLFSGRTSNVGKILANRINIDMYKTIINIIEQSDLKSNPLLQSRGA